MKFHLLLLLLFPQICEAIDKLSEVEALVVLTDLKLLKFPFKYKSCYNNVPKMLDEKEFSDLRALALPYAIEMHNPDAAKYAELHKLIANKNRTQHVEIDKDLSESAREGVDRIEINGFNFVVHFKNTGRGTLVYGVNYENGKFYLISEERFDCPQ